jgi:hypothetical protein
LVSSHVANPYCFQVETAAATAQRVAKEQAKELEVKRAAKKKEEEARLAARCRLHPFQH